MDTWCQGNRRKKSSHSPWKPEQGTCQDVDHCTQACTGLVLWLRHVLRAHGYEVTTLDIDPRYGADLCVDILGWDHTQFAPSHFDVILACLPCTEYSRALTTRQRHLEDADALVRKTLEVIEYLQPRIWVLEKPAHGLLRARGLMEKFHSVRVDHCQFANYGYQKPKYF